MVLSSPLAEILKDLNTCSKYIWLLLNSHALVVVVQLLSCIFATPWIAACQAVLPFAISQSLLKLVHWLDDAIWPSHPLSLLLLPSVFPSIRVFSNESVPCIRWPKYCSFSFSIRPSNEYSGLISLGIDWFDLLAVPLKSLLQHHSLKASVLWCLAFFMVHLSHPYMITWKTMRALVLSHFSCVWLFATQ